MTQPSWRIRPVREDDEPALIELFRRSFGREITAAHYRWKVRSRSTPVENVALAVDHEDRPIFHLAGIPCRCRVRGQERWAMVAVDGMTDPGFRRQGLLTGVGSDLFARWREAGVALVLGLPNEQWRSRITALGWRELFPLAWLVRPLAPERILARRLHFPLLNQARWLGQWWRRQSHREIAPDITVREVGRAGGEIDQAWAAANSAFRCSLIKDAAWVNWRYFDAPDAGFRILVAERAGGPVGYVAFRLRDGSGVIADVVAPPDASGVFQALVQEAAARLADDGAGVVRALTVPGGQQHGAFRAAGFWPGRHRFPVYAVLLDPDLRESDLRDASQWSLAAGDFDVV